MHFSSRLLYRTAIVFLGLMLVLGVFIAINGATAQKASALDATEWGKVKASLDSYISSQYTADAVDGESGFTLGAAALKSRTDSNGDGVYLGEGDDAANAPVLVDVLNGGGGGIIQGTSAVTTWNVNTTDAANTALLASKVANHELAGFSTDIVTY